MQRGTAGLRRRTHVGFASLLVSVLAAGSAFAQTPPPAPRANVTHPVVAPTPSPAPTAVTVAAKPAVLPASKHRAPEPLPNVGQVARVVLGLVVLLALALIAGHRSVAAFERRAGLSMIAATGMPFLFLGVLARIPAVGIMTDAVVADLRPLLEFGLGWIGFRVGTEFDVRDLDRLPRGVVRLLTMESALAFVVASLGSMAALMMVGFGFRGDTVRDGLILGACAAVSAPSGARALEAVGVLDQNGSRLIRKVVLLDDAVPIVVLALVTAIFRPMDGGQWHLPPLGWVFVQIGMGAALGILTVAMDRTAKNLNEEVALTLGAIAFASGMASYLGFSPLAVGCVAGIVLSNLTSGPETVEFQAKLRDLERPIFMAFCAVTGALWDFRDWRGWAIVPLFVIARMFGKLSGARAAFLAERSEIAAAARLHASEPPDAIAKRVAESSWIPALGLADARALGVALLPTSAVSIAVIISAHQAYPTTVAPYLETIVIAGGIAAEVVFQFTIPSVRKAAVRRAASSASSTEPPSAT